MWEAGKTCEKSRENPITNGFPPIKKGFNPMQALTIAGNPLYMKRQYKGFSEGNCLKLRKGTLS